MSSTTLPIKNCILASYWWCNSLTLSSLSQGYLARSHNLVSLCYFDNRYGSKIHSRFLTFYSEHFEKVFPCVSILTYDVIVTTRNVKIVFQQYKEFLLRKCDICPVVICPVVICPVGICPVVFR